LSRISKIWRRISRLDFVAAVLATLGLVLLLAQRFAQVPGTTGFIGFLASLSAIYLFFRLIGWWRSRLLWSLRNRLIVAYLFIAVVPILLLLTLTVLAAQIFYSQLGAFLLHQDLQRRVAMVG